MLLYLKDRRNIRSWLGYNFIFNQGLRRPIFTVKTIFLGLCSFGILVLTIPFALAVEKWWVVLLTLYLAIPLLVSFLVLCLSFPSLLVKQIIVLIAKVKIWSRKSPLVVIGITGSYGKTSTKYLLEHVLKTEFDVFATRESHNTLFSVATDIVKFLSSKHTHAVIEYAAYKRGEIKQMARLLNPQIAIVTGITKQHYGLFGSDENLIRAKFEILESLPSDGLGFINCSDRNTKDLQILSDQRQIRWRCFETRNWKIGDFRAIDGYLNFFLQTPEKTFAVKTNLLGDIYSENIKAVIAVSEYLGISAETVVKSMQSFYPKDHFIKLKSGVNQSTLLDDGGTSNPKGFESAIKLVGVFPHQKKVLVTSGIVDLGDVSTQIHVSLGKLSGKFFDEVFYTGADGFDAFSRGWNNTSGNKPIFRILENTDLRNFLQEINKNSLVLIEGRIPIRILNLLMQT